MRVTWVKRDSGGRKQNRKVKENSNIKYAVQYANSYSQNNKTKQ